MPRGYRSQLDTLLLVNQGWMDNLSPNQFRSFINLPIMSQIYLSVHPH